MPEAIYTLEQLRDLHLKLAEGFAREARMTDEGDSVPLLLDKQLEALVGASFFEDLIRSGAKTVPERIQPERPVA